MRLGPERSPGTLGTFAGVFTPSILTILGIILFLRLGYVVGNSGLGRTLLIIGLAASLSVLTSVSLSAIATNLRVRGGGDYYLISRTLGVGFGGGIGVVLFLAQAVSIAFYCIGFGEALAAMLPGEGAALARPFAVLAVASLFVLAWLGADWATRFQYLVMAVLGAALASFFVGAAHAWQGSTLTANWRVPDGSPAFWVVFAIFFPAVTGFTQGVSMSGDLKDPAKSLPLGTFAAVGISTVVYVAAAFALGAVLPGAELARDYASMRRVARVAGLVDAGVLAATLSSAMASFLGAPRILQSMARDRIFRSLAWFAHGHARGDNPRRGVLLAAGIALITVGIGNLNVIAPVVSMFFLISYGLLNYATFYEARAASPSFRPRFRWFDARLSLLGGLGCLGVMLAINPAAAMVAVAVLFASYQYLRRTAGPARWADSSRSYHFQRMREHLHAMARAPEHPRDWRPQLLVFSNDSPRRMQLLCFASWVEGGSGLTTVVQVLEGEGAGRRPATAETSEALRADIEKSGVPAFPLVVRGADLGTVGRILLQSFGIGPVRANTILLNWLEEAPPSTSASEEKIYGRHLRMAIRLGCNVVVLAAEEDRWSTLQSVPQRERRIDVWWWDDASSRLMLLLAYLMTRSDAWEEATIRVLVGATSERTSEKTGDRVRQMLEEVRIEAQTEVVAGATIDKLRDRSADATLVFVPLRLRGHRPSGPFGGQLDETLERLPVVALVLAAEDIPLDVEPDEGEVAELAAARDAARDAAAEAERAERDAMELGRTAAEKQRQLEALAEDGGGEKRAQADAEAREATRLAAKAARDAEKARARADAAARAAEDRTAKPADRPRESRASDESPDGGDGDT